MQLNVRDLTVAARGGALLLDIPQLQAMPGTALGLRGASGAGKSTLLRALMGLSPNARGSVVWGETELLSMAPKYRAAFRRMHMGMIFQDFLLFDELGPGDNASMQAMFSPRDARARLTQSAGRLLDRLGVPKTGRSVASFSGGERQRVAVARALAHDPRIVLADEPTASLDRDTGEALADALLSWVQDRGITLVVASHDERLLDRMDRVVYLDHGRATEAYA